MRRRSLGDTGIEVSELALGTWGLSGDGYGPVSETEQDRVIERARALGVTTFDTADSYALGAMEARLGRLLGSDRSVVLITKVGTDRDAAPPRKRFERAYLRAAFARSQDRLQRSVLDVVLLHNPSLKAIEAGEATGTLEELVHEGQLRAWGVSAGSEEVARAAINRGAPVVQLAYNLFCASDLNKLADLIRARHVGVLARSCLAYGLLCGLWGQDKRFDDGDHRSERWTTDELKQRIRQLSAVRPLVFGQVTSLRAAALRFVLNSDLVSSAVLGPRGTLQLDQLVREAGKEPPYLQETAITALRARLRDTGVEI